MNNKTIFSFYFMALTAVLFLAPAATAQEHISYCEGIESTSDMLKCVNRHREDAQVRLSMVYREVLKGIEDQTGKDLLLESQNNWITYRDEHCKFEKSQAEAPAFERIYEISCITRLTEHRAEQLSMSLFHSGSEKPREFGTFPRWMNVLAHEHPDIFWRYGQRQSGDIDCDGESEQIVSGVRIKPFAVDDTNPQKFVEAVIAIAEDPVTGKPRTEILLLPAGEEACTPYTDITFVSGQEEEASEETCNARLILNRGGCKRIHVHWTGKVYDFLVDPSE
jgi:uncharacterized protein YecT (DUF1311 family)